MEGYEWSIEDAFARCPSCGSYDVVIEVEQGYFFVVFCKKCGFKVGD